MPGLSTTINPLVIALMALIVLVLSVGNNPRLFKQYRQQTVQLDTPYADETRLQLELERMLGARVHKVTVQHLDLMNDTTLVDVRYQAITKPPTQARFLAAHDAEQRGLVGSAR
jgi:hypothetical protein